MYTDQLAEFYLSCEDRNVDVSRSLYWYHTVDLGNGLVTPGVFDYRQVMEQYCFPDSMQGLSVLDIGAATGYFSITFARRGAKVTATELSSLEELDVFPGQTLSALLDKTRKYLLDFIFEQPRELSLKSVYNLLLLEPFNFCTGRQGLDIERKFVNIYNLTPFSAGKDSFDWVFIGDVLLHTINPLQALMKAASLCSGTLVIAQKILKGFDNQPVLLYTGGGIPDDDCSNWWCASLEWFVQVLTKAGFRSIKIAGEFEDIFIPTGHRESKTIIHATR